MKINKTLLGLLLLVTVGTTVYGQCDNSLIEKATAMVGVEDAQLIKPYMVNLLAGNIERPVPVGKFRTRLHRGDLYRFGVKGDAKGSGQAVLQIYDQNILLASTYDPINKIDESIFEFKCEKTKSYDIVMFFHEGRSGCAAAVISSVFEVEKRKGISLDDRDTSHVETLYIGVDNPLYISTSDSAIKSIKVNINYGSILYEQKGHYTAKVIEEGEAIVTVTSKYKDGRPNEKITIKFNVEEKPLPEVTLEDIENNGSVTWSEFDQKAPSLKLKSEFFEIEDYQIDEFNIEIGGKLVGKLNFGEKIHKGNMQLLRQLPKGQKVTFSNIIIITPEGEKRTAASITYTIE